MTPALCRWEAESQRGGSRLSLRPALANCPALDSERPSAKLAAAGCLRSGPLLSGGSLLPGSALQVGAVCVSG